MCIRDRGGSVRHPLVPTSPMGLAYTTSLATSGNGATTGLVPRITSPMIPTTRWDQNTASAGYYAGVLTYVIARTATVTGWQPGVRIRLIVPLAILASGVWTVAHEQQLPNHDRRCQITLVTDRTDLIKPRSVRDTTRHSTTRPTRPGHHQCRILVKPF